jgi:hypothetical protein
MATHGEIRWPSLGSFDGRLRGDSHGRRHRSQRSTMTWERMLRLADRWLPQPRILHPWPEQRFAAITQGRSPVR